MSLHSGIELEFGNFGFKERGKPAEYPEKNLSEQSREPANSTRIWRPHPGIKPGKHWLETSFLTTAPNPCSPTAWLRMSFQNVTNGIKNASRSNGKLMEHLNI